MIVLTGYFLLTILSLVRKRLKVQLWNFLISVTKCEILVLVYVSYLSKKVNSQLGNYLTLHTGTRSASMRRVGDGVRTNGRKSDFSREQWSCLVRAGRGRKQYT